MDFSNGFDSTRRYKILKIFQAYGIPELVLAVSKTYEKTRTHEDEEEEAKEEEEEEEKEEEDSGGGGGVQLLPLLRFHCCTRLGTLEKSSFALFVVKENQYV
ncbi:Hypothetical predicted protein [Octopus vulgaris]|uniref:Uncharacterized protein n=1 Tax=Octopus vulgaris TaxID=6645 RepID=A0AA36F634_OCTVU|nr:Hypothetical predicted protein [Octopus vulgaris]